MEFSPNTIGVVEVRSMSVKSSKNASTTIGWGVFPVFWNGQAFVNRASLIVPIMLGKPTKELLTEIFSSREPYSNTLADMSSGKTPKLRFSDGMSCLLRLNDTQLSGFGDFTKVNSVHPYGLARGGVVVYDTACAFDRSMCHCTYPRLCTQSLRLTSARLIR